MNAYLLNDHKVGWMLSKHIMRALKPYQSLEERTHFLFWNDFQPENKYVVLTRHPKEIIISGFL